MCDITVDSVGSCASLLANSDCIGVDDFCHDKLRLRAKNSLNQWSGWICIPASRNSCTLSILPDTMARIERSCAALRCISIVSLAMRHLISRDQVTRGLAMLWSASLTSSCAWSWVAIDIEKSDSFRRYIVSFRGHCSSKPKVHLTRSAICARSLCRD